MVHGCFWHRHGCRKTTTPKTRPEFWAAKFDANCARDITKREALEQLGWRVLTVWECETTNPHVLANRLASYFGTVVDGEQERQ